MSAHSWLYLYSGVLTLLIASCVNPGTSAEHQQQARTLSRGLQRLSPKVSSKEADKMAAVAVEESAKLTEQYKPAKLPWFNNWLVNRGLRDRGLCYHWRNDLFPHLYHLNSKTLDLHLATCRKGTFFEHNGIVVTARGQAFNEGIILDPWRKGGRLWWGTVAQDDRYPWELQGRDLTPTALRPLLMPESSE